MWIGEGVVLAGAYSANKRSPAVEQRALRDLIGRGLMQAPILVHAVHNSCFRIALQRHSINKHRHVAVDKNRRPYGKSSWAMSSRV